MNDTVGHNVCLNLLQCLWCPYCEAIWALGRAQRKLKNDGNGFVHILSIPYILIRAMSYSLVQWHFTECLWLGSDRTLSCAVTGLLKQQAIQDVKWKRADCAITMATVWSNRGGWVWLERSEKKPNALKKNNFLRGSRTTSLVWKNVFGRKVAFS